MALCRTCRRIIPCHCHLTPPVEAQPGVYLADTRSDAPPDPDEPPARCPDAAWLPRPHKPHTWWQSDGHPKRQCPGVPDTNSEATP